MIELTLEEAHLIHKALTSSPVDEWAAPQSFVDKKATAVAIVREKIRREVCNEMLRAMLGSEDLVQKWWSSLNKAFDKSPNDQWELDRESVIAYLRNHLQQ